MAARKRLDEILVERGLCDSRSQAKGFILAGKVRSGTERLTKPGKEFPLDILIEMEAPPRFVGRGGEKLDAFVERFSVSFEAKSILDVGASTGGFTDCSLQHGAKSVTCIDVGRAQLHSKLRGDLRVVNIEKLNARYLKAEDLPETEYDIIMMDLSFISLCKVLPAVWPFLGINGLLIALVKPQFEAKKEEVDRFKGVIKDEKIRLRVFNEIKEFSLSELPEAKLFGEMESPLAGRDGNKEYLLGLTKGKIPDRS
jgi:23S rRNA (cytidine1920-2'-O)/16S rRNA (cytidine1409-2'-O)-methyltransferase